jgi:dynein heavy chain
MKDLARLAGVYEDFIKNPNSFKKIFDSIQPQNEPLPNDWDKRINTFEKMIVLKAIRMDKVLPAI